VYLDEGIIEVKRKAETKVESSKVQQDLKRLGLLLMQKRASGSHLIIYDGLGSTLI